VETALLTHQSQSSLLFLAKIPNFFISFIQGLKTPQFFKAEALRRQFLPGLDPSNKKTWFYHSFTCIKRLLLLLIVKMHGSNLNTEYFHRLSYYDGTL
jgi:hypothetical protein